MNSLSMRENYLLEKKTELKWKRTPKLHAHTIIAISNFTQQSRRLIDLLQTNNRSETG